MAILATMLSEFIEWSLTKLSYLALILILLAAGMGVPIPEDIPLITAGYFSNPHHSPIAKVDTDGDGKKDGVTRESSARVPHVWLMVVAGMIGVLGGDSIVYCIGRRGIDSRNFVAHHIRKVMTPKRRSWTEKHFARHGNLTVFCGRFMPGFRSVVFAMAGMARMSYLRFLLVDGLAALISVPVFILLGWYFAGNIAALITQVKHALLPIVLGIVVLFVVVMYLKNQRAKRLAAAALPIENVTSVRQPTAGRVTGGVPETTMGGPGAR